ncbi:MAG: HDOD domain-containing protein [Desulfobacterales bacterium]|nr:HDOD domain-containing protein [Desulfobacterales bacterium]
MSTMLQTIVKEIKALKPVPQVAQQIMSVVEDPDSSVAEVAKIVQYDPSITANILRVCNSAYTSSPRQVDSVQDAITFLGLDKLVEIVLINCGSEDLKKGHKGYGLDEGDLWKNSIFSALIAKQIAEKMKNPNKQLIFTASMLKDIGKVILSRYVADSFTKINNLVQNEGLSFKDAEKKVIGIDHTELGALVAKIWKFSPKMIYMIRNHHLSDDKSARENQDTMIIYLADVVAMMMGVGVGSDGLAYTFYDDVLGKLNISPIDIQEIMMESNEELSRVEELLKLNE